MSFWRPGTVAPGSSVERSQSGSSGLRSTEGGGDGDSATAIAGGNSSSSYGPDSLLSIADQRRRLPAFKARDQFLFLVEKYQVVIVVGQTGSGKTTQLPQYLAETGWCAGGRVVACTQPRRVAATSVAVRVAEEVGCAIGEAVGYCVRFDDQSDPRLTKIKYMTDGMLFREILLDPLLSRYSVVMIDEAHERSLYTDILVGVLKKILKKRPELRIVVASATLDAEAYYNFYNTNTSGDKSKDDAVVMSLDGRTYPGMHTSFPLLTSPWCCIQMYSVEEPPGDVLVFLTGRDEVETVVNLLSEEQFPKSRSLLAVPLYGGLTMDEQKYAFQPAPPDTRKVVVATNIAEASVTIDGIVYVVDAGFVKIRAFSPASGMEALVVAPVSQASAQQRAGRAGRTRPGKAYRLYTEDAYSALPANSTPEIQRSNLASLVLQLKAIGIENVLRFGFLSPPPADIMARALELLYSLEAVDDYGRLTMPLGATLAEIPLEPMLATMILNSHRFGCSEEMLTIAAVLSVEPVFINPSGQRRDADDARRKFAVEEGDHITYINVYSAFIRSRKSPKWCQSNFLNFHALRRAVSVRAQLVKYLRRFGVSSLSSCGSDTTVLQKCIASGFFSQAAKLQPDGTYCTVRDSKTLLIHPNSVLFRRSPPWIVFHEVVETTKAYMRDVIVIDPCG
ncbi:P-loop containing nucleoside triphosphate hydrolase protein [Entophlyctis helioformis]|nr:P-loop containing nucleoside triphosphate hydrolase protein [Entophlyctis helioformis]